MEKLDSLVVSYYEAEMLCMYDMSKVTTQTEGGMWKNSPPWIDNPNQQLQTQKDILQRIEDLLTRRGNGGVGMDNTAVILHFSLILVRFTSPMTA